VYTAASNKVKGNNQTTCCVLGGEYSIELTHSLCINTNTLIYHALAEFKTKIFYPSSVDVVCVQLAQIDSQVTHLIFSKVTHQVPSPH